jgi:hypothetical protein
LLKDVDNDGKVLVEIHAIDLGNGFYLIADGHRRCTVERLRGSSHIRTRIYPKGTDPIKLWSRLNSKTRTVTGAEWFTAWFNTGGKMTDIPSPTMSAIRGCKEIFGDDVKYLIQEQIPPMIASRTYSLFNKMRELKLDRDLKLKQVGMWIARHRLESPIQDAMKVLRQKKAFEKLRTRIVRDLPFTLAGHLVSWEEVEGGSMKGNNELHLCKAQVTEALQQWVDKEFQSAPVVVDVSEDKSKSVFVVKIEAKLDDE